MSTKIYGSSDDLIEFDGDVYGEVGCYGTDEREKGVLVIFSDGTLIEVKYGKCGQGMWGIKMIKIGNLFLKLESCNNEDKHSDVAHFKDGLEWAYACIGDWNLVE